MAERGESTVETAAARRFLLRVALCVGAVVVIVAAINVTAFSLMIEPANRSFAQMLDGWSRVYRPILYDVLKPQVVFFGPSWTRDAFDPAIVDSELGKDTFNYGISGATAYEVRRFVESSLDNPNLQSVVVDLDSFVDPGAPLQSGYGFDETLLSVAADGAPNRWAGFERALAVTLSGAAIAQNTEFLAKLALLHTGTPRDTLLEAYDRLDFSARPKAVAAARRRVLPPGAGPQPRDATPLRAADPAVMREFMRVLQVLCDKSIKVDFYLTPHDLAMRDCDPEARAALLFLAALRQRQGSCAARLGYWDFFYPNAVTLDGILPQTKISDLYRVDGHPRPPIGRLMAAKMFDVPLSPPMPATIAGDFGIDLLSNPDADAWLADRSARCTGQWDAQGLALLAAIGSDDGQSAD